MFKDSVTGEANVRIKKKIVVFFFLFEYFIVLIEVILEIYDKSNRNVSYSLQKKQTTSTVRYFKSKFNQSTTCTWTWSFRVPTQLLAWRYDTRELSVRVRNWIAGRIGLRWAHIAYNLLLCIPRNWLNCRMESGNQDIYDCGNRSCWVIALNSNHYIV